MYYMPHLSNGSLIEGLKGSGCLKSELVEKIMKVVDRKFFCKSNPYYDCPEPIGFGATISAPHIHAYSLEYLKSKLKQPECHALDVGCGSGYLSLCMSLMNGSSGIIVGIDHIDELVQLAKNNIERAGYKYLLENVNSIILIIAGDGRLGFPAHAPYDVIYVGASAPTMPEKLIEQLSNGGIMLIPVGNSDNQRLQIIEKSDTGSIKQSEVLAVSFFNAKVFIVNKFRFFCDYCETYLTHDSPSVRKTHGQGKKHKENVRCYYNRWVDDQSQVLINKIVNLYEKQMNPYKLGKGPVQPTSHFVNPMVPPPLLPPPTGVPLPDGSMPMRPFMPPMPHMPGMPPMMPPPFRMPMPMGQPPFPPPPPGFNPMRFPPPF
ncbi:hypothetical protein HZS_4900, partial [Henneguya salminicola]